MRPTLEIARWELLRFFKLRDLVLTLVIAGVVAAATFAVSWWQKRSAGVVRLAVIAELPVAAGGRLELAAHPPADEPALRARVARGELDGLLLLDGAGRARLVARKEPAWLDELTARVTDAVHTRRLADLGVAPERVAAALAPVAVGLELTEGRHRGSARLAALVLIGLMLLMLFSGASYLFLSITAEKQQRATEQLFTMTSPQALIDGKLLGLTAMTVVGVAEMALIGLTSWNAFGSASLRQVIAGLGAVPAGDLAVLLAFTLCGTAFWLVALAALFATIDDPNSSARSSALLLPSLPLSVAFIGVGSPDSSMMQVLSFVPLTAMTVVPARVVLGEIAASSVVASLVLLVGSTWLLRRGAARVYAAGMLLYGKEPSLREIWRWLWVTTPR